MKTPGSQSTLICYFYLMDFQLYYINAEVENTLQRYLDYIDCTYKKGIPDYHYTDAINSASREWAEHFTLN